jgi:16S rRNA (guanine527-N7)-methyltransferase
MSPGDATAHLVPPPAFTQACAKLQLPLSAAELRQLGRYLHLLLETNKQFNLTGIEDPDEAWMRHGLDSLSLLPHLGDARSVIDVGSGGGLPGLPIAITRPDLTVTLLEATGKKAKFLASVVGDLPLKNVRVITDRAETIGQQRLHREQYDLAVARAVGPLRVMLELTAPLVRIGGRVLAMKGAKVEQELGESGDAMMTLGCGRVELYVAMPGIEEDAVIVELHKERPTPKPYPRLPGTPKTTPL